ncbi:sugar ABC transporter substrate-binding protein [Paenibacillus sp. CAU 1782]
MRRRETAMVLPSGMAKWVSVLAVSMVLFTAGCLAGPPAERKSAADTAASPPRNEAQLTFGILYPMAHPFYEMITQMTEEAAAPLDIELIVKAPDEFNIEQQIRMMEQMIKQGVDGIAVSPVDGDALAPVIDRAVHAGIPVICFETDSPDSSRLTYIGSNHYEAGKLLGEVLDRLLKSRGMVLVESGFPKLPAQQERLEGMLQHINAYTDIQVLDVRFNNGSEDQALTDMEIMIDGHPHFDAFVSLDLWSPASSILVWKAKGLTRDVVAFGMQSDIKEAIHNGQITAVVSQNEQNWAVEIITNLILAAQKKPLPEHVDTGTAVLTRDTVDSFPDVTRLQKRQSQGR